MFVIVFYKMTIFEVMHDVFVKIGLSVKASEKVAFRRKQKNARPRLTKSQCREGRKTAVPPSFAEVCFHNIGLVNSSREHTHTATFACTSRLCNRRFAVSDCLVRHGKLHLRRIGLRNFHRSPLSVKSIADRTFAARISAPSLI